MRSLPRMAAILVCAAGFLSASGELSNRRAPGFALPDSNLVEHDLQDYKGKIVLIEVMKTDCPACMGFAPILEKVQKRYKGRVQVLSVVTYPPHDLKMVEEFITRFKISYPILYDSGQMTRSYLKATLNSPQKTIPHLFIIDGNGKIVNDFGYDWSTKSVFEGDTIFALLDQMLKGKRL
ncbi:MAG: TlpA disulfide reductase family protein [Acidobacteria bacterium]|nr:TlpA disulfide reductase family protein [Acidobacteriota bacterium]